MTYLLFVVIARLTDPLSDLAPLPLPLFATCLSAAAA